MANSAANCCRLGQKGYCIRTKSTGCAEGLDRSAWASDLTDLHRLVDKALLAARRDQRDLTLESMAAAVTARTALLSALGVKQCGTTGDPKPAPTKPLPIGQVHWR